MANLRVYRDFYCIEYNSVSNTENYTLINVVDLTVEIKTTDGNTILETPTIYNESTGRYYVNIDQYLYDINKIYEINWIVKYTANSPYKTLLTRFKLYPTIVGNNIELKLASQDIDIRLDDNSIDIRNDDQQRIRINNDNLRLDNNSDGSIKLET